MQRIADVARQQDRSIDEQIEELRDRLASVPALQLLANLSFQHLAGDPDAYREYEAEPVVFVEYPTWLYLTLGRPTVPEGEFIDARVSEPIHQLVRSVIYGTMSEIVDEGRHGRGGDNPALARLRMQTRLKEVVERSPGYRVHVVAQLRELFGPLDPALREVLGFGVEEAIRLVEGTATLVQQGLRLWQEGFADDAWRLRSALEGTDDVPLVPGEAELLSALAELPPRDRRERLQAVIGAAYFSHLHEAYIVTPDALAEVSHSNGPTARAFLDAFSLEFGSLPAAGVLRPGAPVVQHRAPLIRLADGHYFAHLLVHLWWALRLRLELALGANPRLKRRYERVRARYLEQSATRAIAGCSAHSRSGSALKYTFDDGQGAREYELDGLVLIDSAVFLVEAKSGAMSAAARRGAPSLVEDLRTLVGAAHAQAARAARYIRSTPEPRFRGRGTQVLVRAADLTDIFLVAATMEPLDAFVTRLAEAAELGVVPPDDRPWPVFDLDLRVITELVEGAGQLVHYLRRRQAVERADMTANDELDWFGAYLADGLQTPGRRQVLLTHTTDLDSYFMSLAGERSPVSRPAAIMPEPLRALVRRLESSGTPGFVEAVTALLDLGPKQQMAFGAAVARARKRGGGFATAAGGRHDISYRVAFIDPVEGLVGPVGAGGPERAVIAIAESPEPPSLAIQVLRGRVTVG